MRKGNHTILKRALNMTAQGSRTPEDKAKTNAGNEEVAGDTILSQPSRRAGG